MKTSEEIFDTLFHLDVNSRVEKKKTGKTSLSYLSWSWAWAEFKKVAPDATYEIKKFDDGTGKLVPYLYDTHLGIMCFTEVTAGGVTHEMWLPVMDGANKAMKFNEYTYKTKYDEKTVQQASMFDVNKTIMRCLVKNLAMFGLGLYIYAGEDLPDMTEEQEQQRMELSLQAKYKAVAQKRGYPNMEDFEGKASTEIAAIMKKWQENKGE